MPYGRAANGFFSDIDTTDDWVEVDFGFDSGRQIILNDSALARAADISYSLLESTAKPVQAELRQNQEIKFNDRYASKVFIKSTAAGVPASLRIYAW